VAVLIPSIDLMGGKIVQLVQGEKKALEFDNFDYWIERFSKYPLVQVIDLDAARGAGNNRLLVNQIVQRLNCQVGGGIRSLETARELLQAGARRVILGSALIKGRQDQHANTLRVLAGASRRRRLCSPSIPEAAGSRSTAGAKRPPSPRSI
jgi:phosphoribosylformimino-5-aminoimidazole carboxamide ribotide isomerase